MASGYNLVQIGFRIGNQFLTISFLMANDRLTKYVTLYYQTNYEQILEVKFDRRNFYNKMLKLGILSEAEPRPANATNRTPNKYRFNAEKYAELKQKGFRLEF